MKKIALAAATLAATSAAGLALAAPGLWPHVYSAKIAGAKIAPLNATWHLAVRHASFSLTRNGTPAVAGSLQISRNRITFHDRTGAFSCRGAQAVATYTWRLNGARLTFTPVRDTCAGRRTVLTHAFTRVA